MTPPINQRLRTIATQLDQASERYAKMDATHRQRVKRSRRPALIGAVALSAAAIVTAMYAVGSRHPQQSQPQQAVNTQLPSTQPADTPTTTIDNPTTSQPQPPTSITQDPSQPPDRTRAPVRDQQGKMVGWVDETNQADMINIPLPADYTSLNPQNASSIGVIIVRDDKGNPVGLMTSNGFVKGGILDGTHIDPAIQQQLISDAVKISTGAATTTAQPRADQTG